MQVSIEQVNSLTRRMTVGIAKERIQKAVQSRLQSVARTAKVNGFRPGKVPMRFVEQKYGEQIYLEVLESLISDTLGEALKAQSLNPVAKPDVELLNEMSSLKEQGGEFSYTATFEVYPELKEIKYQEALATRPIVEIGEADVDEVLRKLRLQAADWQAVSRSPTKEDRVILSVSAVPVGKTTPDENPDNANDSDGNALKFEDQEIGIAQAENVLVGLSDFLLGMMPGETRTVSLLLPANHPVEALANAPVEAQITLTTVKEAVLPEINADFARSLGVESGDETELRTEVTRNMQRELKQALKKHLRSEVLMKLREQNPIDLPSALVEQEIERMSTALFEKMGMKRESKNEHIFQNVKEMFAEGHAAKDNVHAGLLLSELIHTHHIEFSAEQLRLHVEELASTYEDPNSIIRYVYSTPEILKRIQSSVLEEQAIEWLLERMQVTEKSTSFTEFMELVNKADTQI